MNHFATSQFWENYEMLPENIKELADKSFALLKKNPNHPSLFLKKIGTYYSVRVGLHYRALAVESDENLIWFWIGSHSQYDKMLKQ